MYASNPGESRITEHGNWTVGRTCSDSTSIATHCKTLLELGRTAAAIVAAEGWLLMRNVQPECELLESQRIYPELQDAIWRSYQRAHDTMGVRTREPSITVSRHLGLSIAEIDLCSDQAAYRCSLVLPDPRAGLQNHDMQALRRLLPQFTRLIGMDETVLGNGTELQQDSLATQFGLWMQAKLGIETYMIDKHLRVVFSWGPAGDASVVRVTNSRIAASRPHDDIRLRAAVSAVLDGDRGSPRVQGFSLGSETARKPALVARFDTPETSDAPDLAVLMLPRQSRAECDPDVIRTMFDLTRVESRIVKLLCDGFVPKEAAEQMRMTPNTLRHYMKVIFRKLNVHRQSELIALVTMTAGLFGDHTARTPHRRSLQAITVRCEND